MFRENEHAVCMEEERRFHTHQPFQMGKNGLRRLNTLFGTCTYVGLVAPGGSKEDIWEQTRCATCVHHRCERSVTTHLLEAEFENQYWKERVSIVTSRTTRFVRVSVPARTLHAQHAQTHDGRAQALTRKAKGGWWSEEGRDENAIKRIEKEGEKGRNPMRTHTHRYAHMHSTTCLTFGCSHIERRMHFNSCQGWYNTQAQFSVHLSLNCHLENNTCTNETFCRLLVSPWNYFIKLATTFARNNIGEEQLCICISVLDNAFIHEGIHIYDTSYR